jgi:transcriptional regulator with XRE-family HTH domain
VSRRKKTKRKASRRARTLIDIDAPDPLPPALPPRPGELDIFSRLTTPVLTGRKVRKSRIALGWSEKEFAERLRISPGDLRVLESSPDPVPDRVQDIVYALRQERSARLATLEEAEERKPGRRPGKLKITEARITMFVFCQIDDPKRSLRSMTSDVYPEQPSKEHAYKSLMELRKRYRTEIGQKIEELKSLPAETRRKAVDSARLALSQHPPK